MEEKDTISELKGISPLLLTVGKNMPFATPKGYFEALTNITAINCLHIDKGGMMLNSAPFAVSQAYFDDLPVNILSRVRFLKGFYDREVAQELSEMAPILSSIYKRESYTVPPQYFANTTISVISAIKKSAVRGKLISFSNTRKWVNYASVAMVTGILVMGAFLFTDNHERLGSDGAMDVHNELHKLSDEELNKYLDNVKATMNLDQITSVSDADIPDVEENLKGVSDEELKQYLKENEVPETKSETGS